MGFANIFFLGARICQGIFSLAALACGIYINHVLKQFAADAQSIEDKVDAYITTHGGDSSETNTIEHLIKDFVNTFTGPTTRGYVLVAVSIWSLLAMTYLLVAQYSTKHPRLNKRSFRIPLELFTVLFWFGGFVAIVSVAIEYEAVCTPFDAFEEFPVVIWILDQIPIVSDLLTTCMIAITASVAAAICWTLWLITSFAACCVNREGSCCGRRSKKEMHPEHGAEETLMSMQKLNGTPKTGFMASESPITPHQNNYTLRQNTYTPLQTDYSGFTPGNVTSPTYHGTGYGQQQAYFNTEQPTMSRGAPVGTVKRKQLPQLPPGPVPWRTSIPQYPSRASQGYAPAPQYASPQSGYDGSPTGYWNR